MTLTTSGIMGQQETTSPASTTARNTTARNSGNTTSSCSCHASIFKPRDEDDECAAEENHSKTKFPQRVWHLGTYYESTNSGNMLLTTNLNSNSSTLSANDTQQRFEDQKNCENSCANGSSTSIIGTTSTNNVATTSNNTPNRIAEVRFDVLLRVDKNKTIPCLELLFVENDCGRGRRKQTNKSLGYILLEQGIANITSNTTSIIGSKNRSGSNTNSRDPNNSSSSSNNNSSINNNVDSNTPHNTTNVDSNYTVHNTNHTNFSSKNNIDNNTIGNNSSIRQQAGAIVIQKQQRPAFFLRGLHISESYRGKNLSRVFVAIFLKLCIKLNIVPATRKIDKPLLSLVLQEFGMMPERTNVCIKVLLNNTVKKFDLVSNYIKSLNEEEEAASLAKKEKTSKKKRKQMVVVQESPVVKDDNTNTTNQARNASCTNTKITKVEGDDKEISTTSTKVGIAAGSSSGCSTTTTHGNCYKLAADKSIDNTNYSNASSMIRKIFCFTENEKQTRSVFSHSYLKTQNMVLLTKETHPEVARELESTPDEKETLANISMKDHLTDDSSNSINKEKSVAEKARSAYVNTPFQYNYYKNSVVVDMVGEANVKKVEKICGALELTENFCANCFTQSGIFLQSTY